MKKLLTTLLVLITVFSMTSCHSKHYEETELRTGSTYELTSITEDGAEVEVKHKDTLRFSDSGTCVWTTADSKIKGTYEKEVADGGTIVMVSLDGREDTYLMRADNDIDRELLVYETNEAEMNEGHPTGKIIRRFYIYTKKD